MAPQHAHRPFTGRGHSRSLEQQLTLMLKSVTITSGFEPGGDLNSSGEKGTPAHGRKLTASAF